MAGVGGGEGGVGGNTDRETEMEAAQGSCYLTSGDRVASGLCVRWRRPKAGTPYWCRLLLCHPKSACTVSCIGTHWGQEFMIK